MKIGQAARQAGVNVQSLRYYERRGLLFPEGRGDSGYRLYAREAVDKVRFIKNAQSLGFSLEEIEELLNLRISRKAQCRRVQRRAEAKLKDVRARMADLENMEKTLSGLIRTCLRKKTTDPCPILKCIEEPCGKIDRRRKRT